MDPADPPAPRQGTAAPPEDLLRDAGLRGEAFRDAAVALSAVFAVGLLVIIGVLLSRRRGRRDPHDGAGREA